MPEQLDLSFKDFSLKGQAAQPKHFKIDGDEFFAPAVIPADVLGILVEAGTSLSEIKGTPKQQLDALIAKIADVMDLLLTPETAPRFKERLYSRTEPMDLYTQAIPAMQWLVEVYSQRPTQPPSSSASGPEDGGGGLTAIAPSEGSTPLSSQLPVS